MERFGKNTRFCIVQIDDREASFKVVPIFSRLMKIK
jgi:hypothetical protein